MPRTLGLLCVILAMTAKVALAGKPPVAHERPTDYTLNPIVHPDEVNAGPAHLPFFEAAGDMFGVLADHASKRGVMGLCLALQIGGLALVLRADAKERHHRPVAESVEQARDHQGKAAAAMNRFHHLSESPCEGALIQRSVLDGPVGSGF